MIEDTKQLGIRIPASQYFALKQRAKINKLKFTELIISIFDDYLDETTPGLCLNCHYQNPPDAKFCSECSNPLKPDAYPDSTNDFAVAEPNSLYDVKTEIEGLKTQLSTIEDKIRIIDSGKYYEWVENRKYDEEQKRKKELDK